MLSEQMARQTPDKKLFVSAGSNIAVPLNKKHIVAAGASGPATILDMPNVSEAEGFKFIISCSTVPATTGSRVKIDYSDGNASASISTSINTTNVDVEMESDGRFWLITR